MKRICSIVTAIVMGLTIFAIPTLGGAAYAEEDQDVVVNATEMEDEATLEEDVVQAQALEVDGLRVTGQTASTITIQWNAVDGAVAYKCYANGKEETVTNTEYTVSELTPSTTYTIKVCAVDAEETEGTPASVQGTTEAEAVMPTAPASTTITKATPGYTNIKFEWSAVADADGYAFSRYGATIGDGKFMDNGTSTVYNLTKYGTYNLKQRTKYSLWVCAYKEIPAGVSEEEAKEEGAVTLNPSGKLVLLSPVTSKTATTLSKERVERTKYDKGYLYKYYDQNGVYRGTSYAMWSTIKNKKSKTQYLIALDTRRNNVVIYKGKKGNWKVYKHFVCACGMDGHRTPRGDFKIKSKKPKFQTGDKVGKKVVRAKYTCWYATRFKGAIFFHSTLYHLNSKSRHAARHVGKHYSHGCIRLEIKNARWIYSNCKKGTAVISRKYGKDVSYGSGYLFKFSY